MPWKSNLVVLALSAVAFSAQAQSDRQVVEDMVTRSANVCPGHSTERTTPTVKAVPVGALRVMLDRGLVMCPDRRLDVGAPAVFYGRVGVFGWNPEVPASSEVIAKQIDAMTRKDEYPRTLWFGMPRVCHLSSALCRLSNPSQGLLCCTRYGKPCRRGAWK